MTDDELRAVEADCQFIAQARRDDLRVEQLAAHCRALLAELRLWRPLSPEEAERALGEAEAAPMSEEEIAAIVQRATDPAERVTNSEQAQMGARVRQLEAENAELRRLAGELAAALVGAPSQSVVYPIVCVATASEVTNECGCYSCELHRYGRSKTAALAAWRAFTEKGGEK